MSSLVLDSDWNPVASVVIQQYKDTINITYPTEPVTKDKAICGPKSWKENKENMEIDEELTDIYEGRDGDIPEVFGRISPITSSINSQSPCNSPVDFGPFPINNNTTPFNLSLNYNEYIERNTIRIPNIGPGKPTRLSFGYTDTMELCFNPNDLENIKYASGGNIVRSVAQGMEENYCDLCFSNYCQEQAGKEWYPIFNWNFVRKSCWLDLCARYHEHIENMGIDNTSLNFINFVSIVDMVGINNEV